MGLTESPTAFQRWMVSGPEFAPLLREFQVQYLVENDPDAEKWLKHHESGNSAQKTFRRQVLKLADAMKGLGNPFQGDVEELMNIGTGDCASEEVVKALRSMESLGQKHYKNLVKTVIENRTVSFIFSWFIFSWCTLTPSLFLMVNSHPIALPHSELSPYRSFSHGELSPHRSLLW